MTTPAPDGNLPLALRELEDAIHALCSPLPRLIDNRLVHVPSRYLQLLDATEGEQSNTGGGGGSKSRPPCWLDALDALNEIDTAVSIWQPAFAGVPPTVGRLRCIQQRSWRPQDVRRIGQITAVVTEWATAIDALLNPEPVVYLMAPNPSTEPAACTACGTKRVYRKDSTGERVRQPALRVTKDGCRCQHCHASWEPGQLRLLAAALGYPLPAGVLE
jgi:hypothetical protein